VQAALPTLMENVLPLAVPLVVNIGVGAHWQAAHA
jgi:DNA polymerase I-like protein with 3'-5' exonuclease and polymerase domains